MKDKDFQTIFVNGMHLAFLGLMQMSTWRMLLYMLLFIVTDGTILLLWAVIFGGKMMIKQIKYVRECEKELEKMKENHNI